jgi:hypothetical protein
MRNRIQGGGLQGFGWIGKCTTERCASAAIHDLAGVVNISVLSHCRQGAFLLHTIRPSHMEQATALMICTSILNLDPTAATGNVYGSVHPTTQSGWTREELFLLMQGTWMTG